MIEAWSGRCLMWFFIELVIFNCFMLTMIILLFKSRFTNIGIDTSYQFGPQYMSYLANSIVSELDMDLDMEKRTFDQTETYYVNKTRKVLTQGIELKIKLNKASFDDIFNKLYINPNEYNIIEPEKATQFIKENI